MLKKTNDNLLVPLSGGNIAKPNAKPILPCTVRHTIAIAGYKSKQINRIMRIALIVTFYFIIIVGSIFACLSGAVHFVSISSNQSADGQWMTWGPWSKCSLTCSSDRQKYGTIIRNRYCYSEAPNIDGKNCSGKSQEIKYCFNNLCHKTVDGRWGAWSEWSSCSTTCNLHRTVSLQRRQRKCISAGLKDNGKACLGKREYHRFCSWLPQCDNQWGNWYISGPCEPQDKKLCTLGSQHFQRQCMKSSSNGLCEGSKEKVENCWYDIGCPVEIQPPQNLQVFTNGTGFFNISWSSVPYGNKALKYRIYKTIEDETDREVSTSSEDINALPSKNIIGHSYWKLINLSNYITSKLFKQLAIRMSAFDNWKEESVLTDVVRSLAHSVDGEWGEWTDWSYCSTKCIDKRGHRVRTRGCNNPAPSKGGKFCVGDSKQQVICFGIEINC